MWFRQRSIKSNLVVPLDESDSEWRGYEVLDSSLLLFLYILALNDLGDMFSDGRISACHMCDMIPSAKTFVHTQGVPLTDPILIHQADQICFCQQVRRCRVSILELAYRWHKRLAFFKVRNNGVAPLVVRVDLKVVASRDDEA